MRPIGRAQCRVGVEDRCGVAALSGRGDVLEELGGFLVAADDGDVEGLFDSVEVGEEAVGDTGVEDQGR